MPAATRSRSGSSPLLSRRWAIPTSDTFGPPVEKMVKQLRETSQDQGSLLLCNLHPLAVKDLVLMRTVGGLLAVNFTTGKRVWPGPVDESIRHLLDPGAPSHSINQPIRVGAARQVPNPVLTSGPRWLGHRLYEDATYGTMSSDGLRVFCIEDLDSGLGVADQWQIVNPNGRRVTQSIGPRSFNRLAAYDIATEGKLKWEAGGPPGEPQSDLAGAFFLGPPLPLADKVYALSELKGEIRLVALDATTGKLEWSQQLAVLGNDAGYRASAPHGRPVPFVFRWRAGLPHGRRCGGGARPDDAIAAVGISIRAHRREHAGGCAAGHDPQSDPGPNNTANGQSLDGCQRDDRRRARPADSAGIESIALLESARW